MTVWGDIGGVDSTSRIPGDTHGDPVHVVCPAAQRARKGGGSGSLPSPPPGRFGKTEGRPRLSAAGTPKSRTNCRLYISITAAPEAATERRGQSYGLIRQ